MFKYVAGYQNNEQSRNHRFSGEFISFTSEQPFIQKQVCAFLHRDIHQLNRTECV